jgi:nucleotidyltransferase/DNA polymerase involved in DNA repair
MAGIDAIKSIEPLQARQLRRSGIRTTQAFLRRAGTSEGRCDLARRVSLTESQLLEIALQIDLMRIKGIGTRYCDLLNAAGVFTVEELRSQNPETLLAMIGQINRRRHLARRLPTLDRVAGWVDEAESKQSLVER